MPKQLLVADDSLTIRKVIGMVFAVEDVSITFVDNGMDAISRARELKPDCVLADVLMPGKSGYEVCEALKADPATASIRVLLLAGNFEPFDEARARAVRADDFIVKPFESQALIDKVRALVGLPAGIPPPARAYVPPPTADQAPFAPRPRAPMAGMPARPPLAGSGFTPAAGVQRPPSGVPQPMPGPAGVPRPPGAPTPLSSGPTVPRPTAFPGSGAPAAPRPPGAAVTQSTPGVARPPSAPYVPASPRPGLPPLTSPGLPRPPGASLPTQTNPALVRPPGQPFAPAGAPRAPAPLPTLQPRARESFTLGTTPGVPAPAPQGISESVEEMTLDVGLLDAPTPLAPPASADGGEAALRAALKNASQEVIERIAWEVVPQLAETIIKEYVERTMREREAKA
ncbi:MAG: response regulator [Myxococcaceae bacterium]